MCVCLRPAVQNKSGGLPEDSRGEPYNSSKDSTLMMREVMNDKHTLTHTCTSASAKTFIDINHSRLRRGGEALSLRVTVSGTTVTSVTSLTSCSRATRLRPRPQQPCRNWATFTRSDMLTVRTGEVLCVLARSFTSSLLPTLTDWRGRIQSVLHAVCGSACVPDVPG